MTSGAHWKPYFEKASVNLQLLGFDVETGEFGENLGLKPTFVRRGTWCFETREFVSSSDVNEHLRYLLRNFLPLKAKIEELRPSVALVVSIRWDTNRLTTGSGPIIDSDCVLGLAQLGARLAFEVFQHADN